MSGGRFWLVVASMGMAGSVWAQPAKPAKGGALSEREQRLAMRRDSKLNDEVAAVYRSADTTYLVGDVSRAAELFQKVLSMAPASNYSVRAMTRLGDCSYELKNYDTAAAHYRRAAGAIEDVTDELELAAGVRADYMVGQSFLAAKNYTSCFGAFRKFIDRHPAHPLVNVAYQSIGDAHLALEQYQQALQAYRMVGTVVGEKTAAHKRLTPGNRLYLRVTDADVNVGETPRGVKAIVKTSSGDVETVELEPMGLRSAVFLGTIPTALASPRHSGDLDKGFTEADAGKIRQMLIDAEQMAQTARQKQQDAADVERSVEKATNPAGAEKKRTTLMAEAEQLNIKSRETLDAACKKVDEGFASIEKIVEQWAPDQSAKAMLKARAATSQPTTQAAAGGGDAAADMRAAMAKTIATSDEDELTATTRPSEAARQMSENDVDKVRMEAVAKPTSPENIDTRLTAISVWSRLLKRQFQRLEIVGGDKIEIEYVDEIGPKGPQNVLRKDSVEVASDGQVDFLTRDGVERVSQIVLGGEVMLRVEDLDRDTSNKADTITVTLGALPKIDTRAAELKEQTRPTSQPTTQRATPGEVADVSVSGTEKKVPLAPEGMPSLTVTLTETGPHTGIFTRIIKTSPTSLDVDGKTIPLAAGGQLRIGYLDEKAVRHADGWVVAKTVECIADAGGEALAVKFGQTYLDLQAKLKRAVAAGEVGKIYLDLGLVKRGKSYLSSAQADCNEVARAAAKTALGEEALYHSWRIYFYAGLLDESVNAARSLMSAYPQSDYIPEAMLAIGQASLTLGEKQVEEDKAENKKPGMNRDLQRAVSQLDELARRYPKSPRAPEAMFLVGQAKIAAGQTGLDTFEKLAKQFPDSAFAARGLAKAADYYVSIGDFRRAQEYFGRILIDYPDSPELGDVTLKRGICQYKLGQSAEALASFYKVAEEHPGTELAKQASKFIGFINQNRGASNEK